MSNDSPPDAVAGALPYRDAVLPDPSRFPALYDPESIAIATFLGSTLAGAVLWALNERRVGRPQRVLPVLAAGVGLVVVQAAVGSLLPTGATGGICIGMTFAARGVALRWQQDAAREGRLEQTRKASRAGAVGIGLLMMVLLLAGLFGVGFLMEHLAALHGPQRTP